MAGLALLGMPLLGLGLAFAAQLGAGDTIKVSADSLKVDYDAHTLTATNFDIANQQGTMLIRAKEARAKGVEVSFNNMQWEFSGDVHIEVDGAVLDAATATASFRDNRLDTAQVVGSPAQFSHLLPGSKQRNQGRSKTIGFDAGKSQVRLAGDVWYSDGRNEVNSPVLVYSLTDRSFEKKAGDGERVRLTIRPGTGNGATPSPATSPPATSPPATSAPTTAPQPQPQPQPPVGR